MLRANIIETPTRICWGFNGFSYFHKTNSSEYSTPTNNLQCYIWFLSIWSSINVCLCAAFALSTIHVMVFFPWFWEFHLFMGGFVTFKFYNIFNLFIFPQKFRFCGDCDCPDWVLAEIHSSLSILTSVKLKILAQLVAASILGEDVPVSIYNTLKPIMLTQMFLLISLVHSLFLFRMYRNQN